MKLPKFNRNEKVVIIILLASLGVSFVAVSTYYYVYHIPHLDSQIEERNSELWDSLRVIDTANFEITNMRIFQTTVYDLSQIMNVSNVSLVDEKHITFYKNGTFHYCGDDVLCTELYRSMMGKKNSIVNQLRDLCLSKGENCTSDELNEIYETTDIMALENMIPAYTQIATENLNRILNETSNLESTKDGISYWALIFQVFGIVLIQISALLPLIWLDKRSSPEQEEKTYKKQDKANCRIRHNIK